MRAAFAYEPADATELALSVDMLVEVLEEQESGWVRGRAPSGETGWFPASYCVRVSDA